MIRSLALVVFLAFCAEATAQMGYVYRAAPTQGYVYQSPVIVTRPAPIVRYSQPVAPVVTYPATTYATPSFYRTYQAPVYSVPTYRTFTPVRNSWPMWSSGAQCNYTASGGYS